MTLFWLLFLLAVPTLSVAFPKEEEKPFLRRSDIEQENERLTERLKIAEEENNELKSKNFILNEELEKEKRKLSSSFKQNLKSSCQIALVATVFYTVAVYQMLSSFFFR
jgi:hypothetical protein